MYRLVIRNMTKTIPKNDKGKLMTSAQVMKLRRTKLGSNAKSVRIEAKKHLG